MNCAWKELLGILPQKFRQQVDELGKDGMQELRLRLDGPGEVRLRDRSLWLRETVHQADLDFCINAASRYSPWNAGSAAQGYLTAPGGHRIGICGEAVVREGEIKGIRQVRSLYIRVARDFPGIAAQAANLKGNILIIGAPGWGKTTLLRDLIRQISRKETVAVVDERGELFPVGVPRGMRTDILTGCPKAQSLTMLLRAMGPQVLAMDEIATEEDCMALGQAAGCGVRLLATAHGGSMEDFKRRKIYPQLVEIFQNVLILRLDQSYGTERMTK